MDCCPRARKYGKRAGAKDVPHSTISIIFQFLGRVDLGPISKSEVRCQIQVLCDVHDAKESVRQIRDLQRPDALVYGEGSA